MTVWYWLTALIAEFHSRTHMKRSGQIGGLVLNLKWQVCSMKSLCLLWGRILLGSIDPSPVVNTQTSRFSWSVAWRIIWKRERGLRLIMDTKEMTLTLQKAKVESFTPNQRHLFGTLSVPGTKQWTSDSSSLGYCQLFSVTTWRNTQQFFMMLHCWHSLQLKMESHCFRWKVMMIVIFMARTNDFWFLKLKTDFWKLIVILLSIKIQLCGHIGLGNDTLIYLIY